MLDSTWEIRAIGFSRSDLEYCTRAVPAEHTVFFATARHMAYGLGKNIVVSNDPVASALAHPITNSLALVVFFIMRGWTANEKTLIDSFVEAFPHSDSNSLINIPILFQSDGMLRRFEPGCIGGCIARFGAIPISENTPVVLVKNTQVSYGGKRSEMVFFPGRDPKETKLYTREDRFVKRAVEREIVNVGGPPDWDVLVKIDCAMIRKPTMTKECRGIRLIDDKVAPNTQKEMETLVRSFNSQWTAVLWSKGAWDWITVLRTACPRVDRDMLVFPGLALINNARVRMLAPAKPDLATWIKEAKNSCFWESFDADGVPQEKEGVRDDHRIRPRSGIRVAVLSMCGVTSFEDRYGLGGEHQVVHWLRESFLKQPDVECCDIFDTANIGLAEPDYYDLVLSNSCWRPPPKTRKNGTTIFWHFNTNAYQGSIVSILTMAYTHVWTNSPVAFEELRNRGIRVRMKHLNASASVHEPYPWESELFCHDAVYVGGYQTEYKGVDLIRKYVKSCIEADFDMAIYGNRKWRYDVQMEALRTDSSFKKEHCDPDYEKAYHGVLHPQDFRILAKNTPVWINFNSIDQRPLAMVNDRPIWAMAAGAFVITDDSAEQRSLYGNTCDYSNGDDIVEKVNYWLRNNTERKQRAAEAVKNIRSTHGLTTDETALLALQEYKGTK